jgi:hypothetical protein
MLPKLRATLLCTIALFATCLLRAQKTLNVGPGQTHITIQSGVNAASDGDIIQIAAGTYFEKINLNGKSITLNGTAASVPGQQPTTILDCGSSGPAFTISSGSPTISNLTIQHCGNFGSTAPYAAATGAILLTDSYPTISNNFIINNNCWGIESEDSSPYVTDNTISATQDPNGECGFAGGAAILISGNRPLEFGGTLPAIIYANLIENNVESGLEDGGDTGGAGIAIQGGGPIIQDNTIQGNATAGGTGGGINDFYSSNAVIVQNLIYGNSAGCGGGGIATPSGHLGSDISVLIANNTLVDNTDAGATDLDYIQCAAISQIYPSPSSFGATSGPDTIFVNNIITGNTTDPAVNCSSSPLNTPSEAIQPIFDHNILHNAGGTFFGSFCIDVSGKYGNITADPFLTNQAGGDFTLQQGSPAIDTGNNSVLALLQQAGNQSLTTDFAGNPRVQDATGLGYPIIDMGAYEYPAKAGLGSEPVASTAIILTSSAYSGPPGPNYNLTANLGPPAGSRTGTVSFYVDNKIVGSSTIGGGIATLNNVNLTPGVHSAYASYPAQNGFEPSVSVIIIINVSLITTNLQLTSSPNPSSLGESVLFTITTSAADGTIPSPITLTDLTSNTTFTPLVPGTTPGVFTYATSTLTVGEHHIEAAYAGTSAYAAASDTLTQIVGAYPTTTTLTCNPTTLGLGATTLLTAMVTSADGTPTGAVSFSLKGNSLGQPALANGTASLTYTAEVPGFSTIIATYVPATTSGVQFAYSNASCDIEVQPLTLTSSNQSQLPAYSPVTFTANLAVTPIPSGTYTLSIGSTAPAAMTPSANGSSATYTTSSLAPGSYTVTATFTPTTGSPYTASLTQIVVAPTGDFTLTGPTTVTTPTEGTATATLSLSSINNFSGSVALTCDLPLPTSYTCQLTPTSVPLIPGSASSVTAKLFPNLVPTASTRYDRTSGIVLASLLPLTLLSLAGLTLRRRFTSLLTIACLTILAASTTSCGKDLSIATTAPGNYPFTITATGTTKGATTPTTHKLNITLTITP